MTSVEREKSKRKEKELRRCHLTDNSVLMTSHVQYTLGLCHQVSAAYCQYLDIVVIVIAVLVSDGSGC